MIKHSKTIMSAMIPACVLALGGGQPAQGQTIITEIIDRTGDGAGLALVNPREIAVDAVGNVYVAGTFSNNVFKITPAGLPNEQPDADAGDGTGEMDPTMDEGTSDMVSTMDDDPTTGRTTPALCGVAMMGTLLMTLVGLLSLSSVYRRGYVLPRR